MHATKAAVEEGIVPGGGVALIRAILAVDKLKLEGDAKVGVNVIKRALEEPFRQIVFNAGLESSVILNEVKQKGGNFGFDARNEKVVDMLQAGIIDPAKVTKQALLNASSIAGLMLTTEALVSEIKEDEKAFGGGRGRTGRHGRHVLIIESSIHFPGASRGRLALLFESRLQLAQNEIHAMIEVGADGVPVWAVCVRGPSSEPVMKTGNGQRPTVNGYARCSGSGLPVSNSDFRLLRRGQPPPTEWKV